MAFILLPGPTRVRGAAGALLLLGIFSAAIAVSLARGRTPDCHCFGQLHSAPASSMTLARNALLAGLAALALAAGIAGESTSAVAWLGGLNGIQLAVLTLGGVVAALTAAVTLAFLSLLRSYGTALLRLDTIERRLARGRNRSSRRVSPQPELGLEPGTTAPAFEVADVNGELVSVDDLLAPGLPLLLLFTSPSCDPCQALLPDIAVWQTEHADRMTIAVAHGGDRDTALAEAQEHDLEGVLVDHDLSLQEAYGARGTPTGVLVAPDGTIASWVAPGADWIERLVVEAATGERDGLPVGSPAPELALVGLDGEPVALRRS